MRQKIKTRVLEEDMEDNTSALGVFQLTESPAGFPTHPQLNIGQQVIVLLPFFTMMALCLPPLVLNTRTFV